jgi:alkanesulfonate monooxygenase SsuD/methylene tetrahydromethanopterin reductase-like flavin-dependent oxidoreductase (luciferase family)|tara:strand:+ start:408 stop:632 length:225 start_codon:yes stop_codon:yes gene_type:complete
MHDIGDLEGRQIPGVGIASTEFIEAAQLQSKALGMEPKMVFVQHPIQDRTDEELRALAEDALDSIVQALTLQGA